MKDIKLEEVICIDVTLLPNEIDLGTWYNILLKTKLIIYDSNNNKNAKPPYLLKGNLSDICMVIDTSTEEGKVKLKELKEDGVIK